MFLNELSYKQDRYIVYCNSQIAIYLNKKVSFHSRNKHVNVIYHWVRNVLESKSLELTKMYTDQNVS